MLRWLTLLLLVPVLPASAQDDPEAAPGGRDRYLGREIARTMHWTGASWLLRQTRDAEENGARLRAWLDVQPGEVVCDFGCGNGYHTLPLAEAVGPEGRVLAVDLQVQMLTLLRERLGERGLENVELIEASIDDPHLEPNSCDTVLMVDVYHELSHPVRILEHVRTALRPGGRLVLVEFRSEDPRVPIKPLHKMSKAQVVRELAANGFAWVAESDELPWQHVMSFTPVEAEPRFEAAQVLGAFRRAVDAGDVGSIRPFLADLVDTGRGGRVQQVDALEDFVEEFGDAGERWGGLRAGLRASVAADHMLLRDGTRRERVELARDEEGALQVVRWVRRPLPHVGPLVAMNTGTGRGTPQEQVQHCADHGYGGIGWGIHQVAEARAACEALGMDVWSVYAVLDVAKDPDPREAQLAEAIAALEGGPGQVWLALQSSGHERHDPAGDEAAQRTLARVLTLADRHGVEVALYPHHGFWMERVEDVQRLLDQNPHPHLGLCFNLCHWFKNHGDADPTPALTAARARLLAVTINGVTRGGGDWSSLIRPLDEGDHDLHALHSLLERLRFDGPVGLQGYGLRQPPAEHLKRSMAVWRGITNR